MARIKIDGDASGLVAAQKQAADSAKQITDEYKDISRQMQNVQRFSKKAWEESRTPLENYNDKLKDLRTLLRQNRITQDEYTAAVRKANVQLTAATQAQSGAFGRTALLQVAQYASAVFGISEAVRASISAFKELEQERSQLARKLEEGFDARAALAQQDPKNFERLLSQARGVAVKGAANAVFQLQSNELNTQENRELFRDVVLTGVLGEGVDPTESIVAAGKLRKNFGNLSLLQSFSALQAAATKTDVGITELGKGVPTVAAAAQPLGFSASETVAALAVLTGQLKSSEVASEKQAGLFKDLAKDDTLRGKTLSESLDKIQARLDAGASIYDVLPSDTAQVAAINLLRKRQETVEATAVTRQGIEQLTFQQAIDAVLQSPSMQPVIQLRREAGIRDVAREEEALMQIRREAATERAMDVTRSLPSSTAFQQMAARQSASALSGLGANEEIIEEGVPLLAAVGETVGSVGIANKLLQQLVIIANNTKREATPIPAPSPEP